MTTNPQNPQNQPQSSEIGAQPAQLTMTIQITRKATGAVEEYTLIAVPVADDTEGE